MPVPPPKELLDLSGRNVLVTGAGAGIGTGIARRFAAAGASLALNYRQSAEGARSLASEIEAGGGRAVALQADVTRRDEVEALVEAARDALGDLDVLVNNAGLYPLHPLLEMDDAAWDTVLDSNLRATFLCTQAVARHMRAAGRGGAIVNVGSIEATNPAPAHSHYDAAKGGVLMHTRAAAAELGPLGIRVNAVSPGLIWREGLDAAWPEGVERYARAAPLGRLGQYDDVGDACLFLASPLARWVTGSEMVVDGGVMCHQIF
jgi:NAD(P)-dependent dehydrogenase (short-subunit alcohol dehydrogenase family)